ncbi:DUF3696 domain-containing protein [Pseudomonas neuropathica]
MISSLALRNFKSIHNDDPLEFKNLSIICGSNSSGKSSILQAILMLSQTFSSRYLKKSVSLNGKLVRLGSFTDILKHSHDENEKFIDIDIEMDFTKDSPWMSIKKMNLSLTFSNVSDGGRKFEGEFHPEIIRGLVSVIKSDPEEIEESIKFALHDSPKSNPELFTQVELEHRTKNLIAKDYPDFKVEGVARQDIIPHVLHINYDYTKKLSQSLVPYLIGSQNYLKTISDTGQEALGKLEIPKAVLDKIRSMIQQEIEQQTKNFVIPEEILAVLDPNKERLDLEHIRSVLARQSVVLSPDFISIAPSTESISVESWRSLVDSLSEKERKSFFDFLIRNRDTVQGVWYANMKKNRAKTTYSIEVLEDLNFFVSYFIPKNIKYLGPLRNEPQAMYQAFDLSEPTMVGLKGENTAAVLHINKSTRITYPLAIENSGKIDIITKNDTLGVACTEWLSYLGVVTDFQTFDKGKLGYELQVKTTADDEMQDLTHVGVGVSQVLPIVVMALLSDVNDVLIFEQPELHLHPKVQSRLTDFFVAISGRNRQCLIETHSEYIINRLRLRIVQSRDDKLRQQSSVLFAGKSGKSSTFQTVDITSFGSIIDWPQDFFDQTDIEVENILLEAVSKKKESAVKSAAGELK